MSNCGCSTPIAAVAALPVAPVYSAPYIVAPSILGSWTRFSPFAPVYSVPFAVPYAVPYALPYALPAPYAVPALPYAPFMPGPYYPSSQIVYAYR